MGAQGSKPLQKLVKSSDIQLPPVAMAKAMKAMKAMKKKTVSKIGRGRYAKTIGGLTSKDLFKNKRGRIVSKKMSAKGKKSPWIAAVQKARKALKITGFSAIKKGTPLYAKAKEFYQA